MWVGVKFVVDAMLGKLAKWLRILGYDTLYFRDLEDEQLIGLAEAEGRVLLTGDGELGRYGIFISSDDWREQLRELAGAVGLETAGIFSRCIECNVPLERVGRAEVEGAVPSYALDTQEEFGRCPECGRIYWKGTHFQNALAEVERLIRSEDDHKS